jgi:hypothetical protein
LVALAPDVVLATGGTTVGPAQTARGSDGMICRIEVVPREDAERLMRVIPGDRA